LVDRVIKAVWIDEIRSASWLVAACVGVRRVPVPA
jgi:hypothetical protein